MAAAYERKGQVVLAMFRWKTDEPGTEPGCARLDVVTAPGNKPPNFRVPNPVTD